MHFNGSERKYEDVYDDDVYAIGVDCAGGVGGDYSCISVVSLASKEIAYQYRSNTVLPVEFAEQVLKVAQLYNDATVLVETNNHGHLVLHKLDEWGYKNLWKSVKNKDWVTSAKSKIEMYEVLREIISNNMITRMDMSTLMELRSMTIFKVAPEAPPGMHDDLADSLALAYRCSVDIPSYVVQNAKRSWMDNMLSSKRANRIRMMRLPYKRAE